MAWGKNSSGSEPTLAETWTSLGQRLGLAVEVLGPQSIRARGTIRQRPTTVSIEASQGGAMVQDFLRSFARAGSRNRRSAGTANWHTELSVGCVNPLHLAGTISSVVDLNAPGWKPGNYDSRFGRSVQADSPELAVRAITPAIHEQLMSIIGDTRITVDQEAVRFVEDGSSDPWPATALVGPEWWIDLLCDIADALDS